MRTLCTIAYALIFYAAVSACATTNAQPSEIVVSDGNVKIKTENGETIDSSKIQNNSDIKVNSDTISIGEVKSNGSSNNIKRKTSLNNVIIIHDGKTTVIKTPDKTTDNAEKKQ
ncbi:hypothetical protein [Desulfovibrio legallii]|jgi:hypothetical protein|uniref:hypothetical protein n=1 Tax=Desulfovibrio legallii TaxID=571438 RepID=UPI0011784F23|nr:hypothetical protein [Desulfovibrio legallii]